MVAIERNSLFENLPTPVDIQTVDHYLEEHQFLNDYKIEKIATCVAVVIAIAITITTIVLSIYCLTTVVSFTTITWVDKVGRNRILRVPNSPEYAAMNFWSIFGIAGFFITGFLSFLLFFGMTYGVLQVIKKIKNKFKADDSFSPKIGSNDLIKAYIRLNSRARKDLMLNMNLRELYLAFLAKKQQFLKDLNDCHIENREIEKMKMIATLSSLQTKHDFVEKFGEVNFKRCIEEDLIFKQIALHQTQRIKSVADRIFLAQLLLKPEPNEMINGERITFKLIDRDENMEIEVLKDRLLANSQFFRSIREDIQQQQGPLNVPVRNVRAATKLFSLMDGKEIDIGDDWKEFFRCAHEYSDQFYEMAKMILTQSELKAISLK